MPKEKRPKLKRVAIEDEDPSAPLIATPRNSHVVLDSSPSEISADHQAPREDTIEIVVQRTFVHVSIPREDEENADQRTAHTF